MRRLFFAARPPEAVSLALADAVSITAGPLPGRPVGMADWHVTLSFLGSVDDARLEPLCRRAAQVEMAPFELSFDRLEYWRGAKVLVACVPDGASRSTGQALVETLVTLVQALGITPDSKPWKAHLTLSRGLAPHVVPPSLLDGPLQLKPVRWSVEHFDLVESRPIDDRRYQTLASWPLDQAAFQAD